MTRGGGCRRQCRCAGARPQGLPPGTGEALSWPVGPTSDSPVPGLALGGLPRPGAAVEVGRADDGAGGDNPPGPGLLGGLRLPGGRGG